MAITEKYANMTGGGGAHDGSSEANAYSFDEMVTNHNANPTAIFRYNLKAGTFTTSNASKTFTGAGTAIAHNFIRGYKTTIGDMVAVAGPVAGTDIPLLALGTGQLLFTGAARLHVSDLAVTSAATASGGACQSAATGVVLDRVQITNSGTNSNSRAFSVTGAGEGTIVLNSVLQATTSAGVCVNLGDVATLMFCDVIGGIVGVAGSSVPNVINCQIHGQSGTGACAINSSGTSFVILNNDIGPLTGDGINISSAPANGGVIAGNGFQAVSGTRIINSTGANLSAIYPIDNKGDNTSGTAVSGITEGVTFYTAADAAGALYTNAPTDYSLLAPMIDSSGLTFLRGRSWTPYRDLGASGAQTTTTTYDESPQIIGAGFVGDYPEDGLVEFYFHVKASGIAAALTSGAISVYIGSSNSETVTGVTLSQADGRTGWYRVIIDTSLDAAFIPLKTCTAMLSGGTVDSISQVPSAVATFTIGMAKAACTAAIGTPIPAQTFYDGAAAATVATSEFVALADNAIDTLQIVSVTGAVLTTATHAAIADKMLGRNVAGASDGGRTVAKAMFALVNRVEFPTSTGGTGTVYAVDDTTPSWTFVATLGTRDALTGVNPA